VALDLVFVAVSLVIILAGAEFFTNAVEWLGAKLGLSSGAVGSVLAAVGTAMPETMIPIVAIVFGASADSHDVGIGAILGAPFLLSTAAFAVTGLGIIAFAKSRRSGTTVRVDPSVIRRDIGYFFLVYLFAIGSSFIPVHEVKLGIAVVMLGLYGLYVKRTFSDDSSDVDEDETETEEEELNALRLQKVLGRSGTPALALIGTQLVFSLALIIAGAQLFVQHLTSVSEELGLPALALALVIAPLATELPEKFNSIIWVRQGKDTLAMGNITGAMVFQSCVPVAVGMVFTDWELTETALVSAGVALASTGIVYLSLVRTGVLSAYVLARAGLLWVGFVGYVIVKLTV
jgi:cation:H+ antiporter